MGVIKKIGDAFDKFNQECESVIGAIVKKGRRVKLSYVEKKIALTNKQIDKLKGKYKPKLFEASAGEKILKFVQSNYEKYGNLINMDAVEDGLLISAMKSYQSRTPFEEYVKAGYYADIDRLIDKACEISQLVGNNLPLGCFELFGDDFIENNKEKFEDALIKHGKLDDFKVYAENFEPKNPEKLVARIKSIQLQMKAEQQAKEDKIEEIKRKKQSILDALEVPEVVKESNVKKEKEVEIPEIVQADKKAKSSVFDIDSEFGK